MELDEELAQYVGQVAEPPRVARYAVNAAMIRNWVEAHDDRNPVYVDPAAARATGRDDVICPPAMISTWVMAGLPSLARGAAAAGRERHRGLRLLAVAGPAGPATATPPWWPPMSRRSTTASCTPGDQVTCHFVIEAISPFKQTALGRGCFLTLLKNYVDDDGNTAGHGAVPVAALRPDHRARCRMTGSSPMTDGRMTGQTLVPPLIRTQDNEFFFDAARAGRLEIQRCIDCGTLRHPPAPACAQCRSFAWDTVVASGRCTLHSWTIVYHPQDPAFDISVGRRPGRPAGGYPVGRRHRRCRSRRPGDRHGA